MTAPATEEQLLSRYAQKGDERALAELVGRRWGSAYRIALRTLGDPAAAEDAAQEAFVSLVRGAGRFDPSRPFGPWFGTILLRSVQAIARSRRRRIAHEETRARRAPTMGGPEGEGRVEAAEIEEHLAKLPLDVRIPLVLHFYEGQSHAEVAASIGCPTGTAASRIRRGVEQLRESLAGAGAAMSVEGLESLLQGSGTRSGPPVPASPRTDALVARARSAARIGLAKAAAATVLVLALGSTVALWATGGVGSLGAVADQDGGAPPPPRVPEKTPAPAPRSSPLAQDAPTLPAAPDQPKESGHADPSSGVAPDKIPGTPKAKAAERGTLSGRVTLDGRPVAKTTLTGWRAHFPRALSLPLVKGARADTAGEYAMETQERVELTTDENGGYELRDLAPGRHMLVLGAPAYAAKPPVAEAKETRAFAVDIDPGKALERNIELAGTTHAKVNGRLIDKARRPVAGKQVAICVTEYWGCDHPSERHPATTDAEGRFEVEAGHPDMYDLEIRDGRASKDPDFPFGTRLLSFAVSEKDTQVVLGDFVVSDEQAAPPPPKAPEHAVRIVDPAGAPLAAVHVSAFVKGRPPVVPRSVETDGKGRAVFEEVPDGEAVVFAVAGKRFARSVVQLRADAEPVVVLDQELASVTGRVLAPKGMQRDVFVSLTRKAEDDAAAAIVRSSVGQGASGGEYAIRDLLVPGRYNVRAAHRAPGADREDWSIEQDDIEVRAGVEEHVDLSSAEATEKVSVELAGAPAGLAVAVARVRWSRPAAHASGWSEQALVSGTAVIENLPAGPALLEVEGTLPLVKGAPAFFGVRVTLSRDLSVAAGTSTAAKVVWSEKGTGTIEGTYVHPMNTDSALHVVALGDGVRVEYPPAGRAFSMRGVPAGHYRVLVFEDGASVADDAGASVEVTADATVHCEAPVLRR